MRKLSTSRMRKLSTSRMRKLSTSRTRKLLNEQFWFFVQLSFAEIKYNLHTCYFTERKHDWMDDKQLSRQVGIQPSSSRCSGNRIKVNTLKNQIPKFLQEGRPAIKYTPANISMTASMSIWTSPNFHFLFLANIYKKYICCLYLGHIHN